jgi:hypothetical protein
MQEIVIEQKPIKGFKIESLSREDKQKIVDVFAWLIEEDKKQNSIFYYPKKS